VDARTVWTIEILFWILTAEIVETGVNVNTVKSVCQNYYNKAVYGFAVMKVIFLSPDSNQGLFNIVGEFYMRRRTTCT
jgi:hypothetical protein